MSINFTWSQLPLTVRNTSEVCRIMQSKPGTTLIPNISCSNSINIDFPSSIGDRFDEKLEPIYMVSSFVRSDNFLFN